MLTKIPDHFKKALLSDYTSRQNKLWMAVAWKHFRGFYLEWKWAGQPFKSRLLFQFEPEGVWVAAKSVEEDLLIEPYRGNYIDFSHTPS